MGPNRALSDARFQHNLDFGQSAETHIARWLLSRGNVLLPAYDVQNHDDRKGPRLFGPEHRHFVVPDFLAWHTRPRSDNERGAIWIETKAKSAWSWYRKGQYWVDGINLRHYQDYHRVAEITDCPVWLLFAHDTDEARVADIKQGAPPRVPQGVGLYGQTLSRLAGTVSHEAMSKGNGGQVPMIYWPKSALKRLACDWPPTRTPPP